MRTNLGAGLLLVSTMLVTVSATPAGAATTCDDPDTTWVGPSADGGSTSWSEEANWTNRVPTAESVVCIPATDSGPHVDTGTAVAATLTLQGTLAIGTSLEVDALEADGGAISGGSTTVSSSITGSGLTVTDGAALDQWGTAVFGAWDAQGARITVHGDAVLAPGGVIDTLSGLLTIAETGSLTYGGEERDQAEVIGGFANHGEVSVTTGSLLIMGASPEDAQPEQFSTGTFTAGAGGALYVAHTELRTGARLEHVTQVDSVIVPVGDTVTITDTRVADAIIRGRLIADPGQTGTATLSGVEVTGKVTAVSGRLSVPSLAPTTLAEDGTLTSGAWIASPGATLDLPSFTSNDATLVLEGPAASFGDGLASLAGTGAGGRLKLLAGADLAVAGPFDNAGDLRVSPGSRLDVGGRFRQLSTGTLWAEVDATGRGRVRAAGPRDLAGRLVVGRDPTYRPPVGTVLPIITSDGRVGRDDAFDKVTSPPYRNRKLRVSYDRDHARLWVDRVG